MMENGNGLHVMRSQIGIGKKPAAACDYSYLSQDSTIPAVWESLRDSSQDEIPSDTAHEHRRLALRSIRWVFEVTGRYYGSFRADAR